MKSIFQLESGYGVKITHNVKFLIQIAFMLLLLSTISKAEEPLFIVIDSLSGQAEIQKAGSNEWIYCQINQKIYNNDVFRVLENGGARLRWPDGSVAYVHKNSQIIVNLLSRKSGAYLSHTTVLFGALFYIVKKVLPNELLNDTKIYTPTAVISIRGTSFLVDVKENITTVKMICGTVLAGNIKKNISMYLGAAFKTSITANTDPIVPLAVLKIDLDSLKEWVPPPIIDSEIEKQRSEAKRNYAIISGKLDEKCIVVSFIDNSGYQGSWDIRRELPKEFVKKMKEHHPLMNISYVDTAGPDLLHDAYKHRTRYIVSGTIEAFSLVPKAEITVKADEYKESLTGLVKIRLEVVDATEKKVISEENLVGEVTRKRTGSDGWDELKNVKFSSEDEKFSKSLIGGALNQAIEQALERCDAILGL
jgi:hypothetical protein